MAKYFFDIDANHRNIRDEIGSEYDDLESVRRVAIASLPVIAADDLPNGDEYRATITVRDENTSVVFTATMNVSAKWSAGNDTVH